MPPWIRAMLSRPPEPWTPLARYTMANGAFYMAFRVLLYARPSGLGALLGAAPLAGQEPGLLRVIRGVVDLGTTKGDAPPGRVTLVTP